MSLVSAIPEIEVRPREVRPAQVRPNEVRPQIAASAVGWFEVCREDLAVWNRILLETEISLYQYPFWNEPHRALWLTPRYLAWGTADRPLAFACILTVGVGPAKIGLVFRGPTSLYPAACFLETAIAQLLDWSRHEGYIFLRFTHSDENVLSELARGGHAENFDAFPYFLDYPMLSPDYIVEQFEEDEATLASFDREARRKLRRAEQAGYKFRCDDSPEALAKAWPLYKACAQRKNFRLERPLSVYMETMRLARPYGCVRLYSVEAEGKVAGSALVFRDSTTAHCLIAAFEREHQHAAVFLHWHAMRDMHRIGARRYNLGPGPGSLARFKRQFCAEPVSYPGAITMVLKEDWFRVWKVLFPAAKSLRPTLRRLITCVSR